MLLVADAEGLDGAVRQIRRPIAEGVHAADVHIPDVHGRVAVDDPVRDHEPYAPAREDSQGVEACGHKEAP